jgi:putative ABC transport system substrate-binding protein
MTRREFIALFSGSAIAWPMHVVAQSRRTEVRSAEEFAPAFAAMARAGDQAAIVIANPLSVAHRKDVVATAAVTQLPTIYEGRSFVTDGGLLSYGPPALPFYRDVAGYVDKIPERRFAGESPGAAANEI